jgi:hypothetical protein
MPTDTRTLDGLLKRVYTDEQIQNLQNMEAETFTKLKKSPRKLGGEGFFGPAHVQGNQRGQGSQNENERLRDPGTQVVKQWKIYPTIFTHTIRFSGLSLDMANGNEESFADNLTFQTDNGVKDSTKELNAQCYRSGSGVIALANGAGAATATVTFDNGIPTHFREGMYLDFVTAGGVKEVDSIELIDIDVANQTLTLASAQSWSDNARITRENTLDNVGDSPNAYGKELAGLPYATDDGTLFASYENIVRNGAGAVPKWRGFTVDGLGVNISNDFLNRMRFRMKVLAGTNPKQVRSNTSQMRKYLDIVIPAIRFKKGEALDSQGSAEVPTWNGMEWKMDTDCGFDEIYMEDSDFFQKFECRPLRLDDTDGKILKWDNGTDGFVAYLKAYVQTGTENPKKGIRANRLNVPTF